MDTAGTQRRVSESGARRCGGGPVGGPSRRVRAALRPRWLQSALTAVVLAACLMAYPCAASARAPTEQELAEINAATARSPDINHEYAPVLSDVRVSAEGGWAAATIGGFISPGLEQNAVGIYRAGPAPEWTLERVSTGFCVGWLLTNLGMPQPVGLELGFALCPKTSSKVFVERSIVTDQLVYRPHKIYLSGDGTFDLYGLRWSSYGGPAARASGNAFAKGCTPDCAEGHVDRPRATLYLSARIECDGQYIYAHLSYVLHGALPSGYRHRGFFSLRPTNEFGKPAC